jgi:hypothetical protein
MLKSSANRNIKETTQMTTSEIKALDREHTMQTYGRFGVAIDCGEGAPASAFTRTSRRARPFRSA